VDAVVALVVVVVVVVVICGWLYGLSFGRWSPVPFCFLEWHKCVASRVEWSSEWREDRPAEGNPLSSFQGIEHI